LRHFRFFCRSPSRNLAPRAVIVSVGLTIVNIVSDSKLKSISDFTLPLCVRIIAGIHLGHTRQLLCSMYSQISENMHRVILIILAQNLPLSDYLKYHSADCSELTLRDCNTKMYLHHKENAIAPDHEEYRALILAESSMQHAHDTLYREICAFHNLYKG
jgi:hypothetical protein